jgi:hypothetical protein
VFGEKAVHGRHIADDAKREILALTVAAKVISSYLAGQHYAAHPSCDVCSWHFSDLARYPT